MADATERVQEAVAILNHLKNGLHFAPMSDAPIAVVSFEAHLTPKQNANIEAFRAGCDKYPDAYKRLYGGAGMWQYMSRGDNKLIIRDMNVAALTGSIGKYVEYWPITSAVLEGDFARAERIATGRQSSLSHKPSDRDETKPADVASNGGMFHPSDTPVATAYKEPGRSGTGKNIG